MDLHPARLEEMKDLSSFEGLNSGTDKTEIGQKRIARRRKVHEKTGLAGEAV